jgi:Kef-type K+ transport system membrane component KefB
MPVGALASRPVQPVLAAADSALIGVDAASFLWVVVAAAVAALLVGWLGARVTIPVVVVELLLGILIGPQVLGLAQKDDFIVFFANLGLGMLFFFAGYEINFRRIAGTPLRLAVWGWLLTLVLAYSIGGLLAWAGVVASLLYTGSAMSTTAIGTLIPILSDAGEMRTRFGTYLLGAGAIGEFGPILLITLALSAESTLHNAAILVAFIALAVGAAIVAVRSIPAGWSVMERTLESSSQVAIRLAVVLIFALVAFAQDLGLDLLLGGFAAGIIVRLALEGREVGVFESKLTAIGYGFLIPFFFITSGIGFDLDALTSSASGMLKLPLFLALFLVVRGVPALVLYRGVLDARDRLALGFFSATQLPLVVAITTIAIDAGEMRSSTAAALVGAAILSTLIFPLVGLHLRRGRAEADVDEAVEAERIAEGLEPGPAAAPA